MLWARRDPIKLAFKQLDSDQDGHLAWPQVRSWLPRSLTTGQMHFMKALYDLAHHASIFGLQEFAVMHHMLSKLPELGPYLIESFEQIENFHIAPAIAYFMVWLLLCLNYSEQWNFIVPFNISSSTR